MLCVGLIYAMLAWRGMRRGLHWPRRTVITSALAGFLSFFSFLGFGYFELESGLRFEATIHFD